MTNLQTSIIYDTHISKDPNAKHVAVLMGGLSREREVSLSSAKGIIQSLKNLGYKVTPIDMGFDIAQALTKTNPDIVFNALHGTYGEDGCVPGLLNILKIPYTHSGVLASALAFDKERTREIMASHGVKMAKGFILNKSDATDQDPMMRPYVAKPLGEGSSVGVSVVFPEDNFSFANYDWFGANKILVEQYIPGREIQVAVINGKAIGTIEIIPKGRFYDYEAKYTDGMAIHLCPAPLAETEHQKLLALAEKIHKILGAKTVSRVDFRYDDTAGENEFYLLELNTHPGFTPLSLVPEIAAKAGISYDELVDILVKQATCQG